jgi:POT family proton-dependent oligopeptide transporter
MAEQVKSLKLSHASLPLFGQFFERFSFWGLESVLVLYLIHHLKTPSSIAYLNYGIFTGFAFMLALLGGIVADQYLGFRRTCLSGLLFAFTGNLFLAFGYSISIYLGLSFIAVGAGLFISSNPNLLVSYHQHQGVKRSSSITLLYVAENAAYIMGSFFYGLIWKALGIKYCFLLSAFMLFFYMIFFVLGSPPLAQSNLAVISLSSQYRQLLRVWLALCGVLILVGACIRYNAYIIYVFATIAGATIAYWMVIYLKSQASEKNRLNNLVAIFVLCLFFFTVLFQMNSSLLMFINQHVNRSILGWHIPSTSFAGLESFFTILWAPLFSLLWRKLKQRGVNVLYIHKVALSLLLQSIGFHFFIYAMHQALLQPSGISPYLVIPGYIFLGAGDICLMPTVITAITVLAPTHLRATLMGMFYLLIGCSGYLAGVIADLTLPTTLIGNQLERTVQVYGVINFIAFSIAAIALLMCYFFRRFNISMPSE